MFEGGAARRVHDHSNTAADEDIPSKARHTGTSNARVHRDPLGPIAGFRERREQSIGSCDGQGAWCHA